MVLDITNSATTPKPNGPNFLDEYSGHLTTLYETGARPLTAVGGTPDVVTATMVVDLTAAGFVDGLCVSLVWAAANTAGVTLAINGGANIPVVDAAGNALDPGAVDSGLVSILRYTSGSWRIMSSLALDGAAAPPFYQAITASTTWNRPAGYSDDTPVLIEAWGGGGGGGSISNGGGGGGGAYAYRRMRYADVPSSVSVTIGSGGAVAAAGAASTFGALLTAHAGGSGNAAGGGGGGSSQNGSNGGAVGTSPGAAGGRAGGGSGGSGSSVTPAVAATDSVFGGGGGGSFNSSSQGGGWSMFGGGGGGGGNSGGIGGTSKFGGNGGDSGVAGSVPGGGGGRNGAGARGEVRIWIG